MSSKVYRAIIRATGEILEDDDFKNVYRCALFTCKDFMFRYSDDIDAIVIEFEEVTYSDDVYMNKYGFVEHPIIDHRHIAFMAVGRIGYTVDYNDEVIEIEKEMD